MPTAREATIRLSDLLRREHCALAEFLVALAAFHRERRWVELGYNSLFSFLVRELGLSKGAAFYRNRAAELVERFPEIVEPLRDGRLCLSSVAELSEVLTPENYQDVLPRYFHLSRSEAKEITAELKPDPAPPLRTVVTGVAPREIHAVAAQPGFLENLVHANAPVPDVAFAPSTLAAPASVEVQPLTAELTRLHVTVPRRLVEKLAAARDALSHSHPRASDDEILELGLDLIVERHHKRRGIGAKPRKPAAVARDAQVARERVAGGRRRQPVLLSQPRPPPPRPMSQHLRRLPWPAAATSPLRSGASSGSGIGGAASGRWKAAVSAGIRAGSSSTTSRAGPSGRTRRSTRVGSCARPTTICTRERCMATP